MIELLKELNKKDLIKLELEQPELKDYLKLIEEMKEETRRYHDKIIEFRSKSRFFFKPEDMFVLSKKTKIWANKNYFELECEDKTIKIQNLLNSLLTDLRTEKKLTVLVKREICESCKKNKNNVFSVNNKKICLDCIEKLD